MTRHETTKGALAMTSASYWNAAKSNAIRFAIGECSLGSILVASTDKGVCALLLGDNPDALIRDLHARFPNADVIAGGAEFKELITKVIAFVEAPASGLDLPLHVNGTAFQQKVWQALQEIPAGKTASYAAIARRIGAPKAARAVAQACAANAIAVAIPCHRIVRNDGALGGYSAGLERKRALLEREKAG